MRNVEKMELTDQVPSFAKKYNLSDEEYLIDDSKILECNLEILSQIQIKL